MKLKLNFGKGGLKGFVVQHAEKAIFGMVLILVAVFVYSSATLETVDQGQSPNSLKGSAGAALTNLNNGDPWATLGPERMKKVDNYPDLARFAGQQVDPAPYTGDPWIKENFSRRQKRQDPTVYPPEQVEVEAGVFAVMLRTQKMDDAWAGDKEATEKPKEQPKAKPKKDKKAKPGASGYPDMPGMPGMGGYPGAAGGKKGGASRPPTMGSGMGPGMMGPGMMGPGMGDEGGGMMSGYGPGTSGGRRQLGPFYISHYLSKGFRPQGMSTTMPGGGVPGVAAKSFAMVAVKALVPYEKQWEAYEQALAGATGYSPAQDIPRYLLFVAERAEVSEDDPNAELQWQPVSNSSFAMKFSMQFAGFPTEVADEAYLWPGALTMPVPPVLLQPYESLALHSQVPKRKLVMNPTAPQPGADEEGKEGGKEGGEGAPKPTTDFTEGLPQIPATGAGAAAGYGMMPGMPGMPGMPTGAYPGGEQGMSTSPYGSGYGMAPGMDMPGAGMGYPGAMSGMPGAYGGPPGVKQPTVKYKMIRFFDFAAEAGKTYRYRVRVMLEDPNRPQNKAAEPNPRILDPTVVARLAKATADDAEVQKKSGTERRTYWLQTEWSEPSPPVTVVSPEKFVGGGATGPRMIKLALNGPSVELEEPKGKVVTVVWDERRATEVPAMREILRGAFLDFEQKADVLQPLTLQIRRIEDFDFNTDAFVADLRGGETLMVDVDKEKKEIPLPVPGEFLVVNRDGSLIACHEVDDAEEYRRLLFIEDTPSGSGSGMMPSGGGYGDMSNYPGGVLPYDSGSGS